MRPKVISPTRSSYCGAFQLDELSRYRKARYLEHRCCGRDAGRAETSGQFSVVREESVDFGRVDIQAHEIREGHPGGSQHRFEVVDTERELSGNVTVVLGSAVLAHRGLSRDVQRAGVPRHDLALVEAHFERPRDRVYCAAFQCHFLLHSLFVLCRDPAKPRAISNGVGSSISTNHDTSCHVFLRESLMRADRLVSLVLLLRQRGRLSAPELARELEVSPRTILRDIEALSAAGVPVYVDRGRNGGFSLLPGFRTELMGLNHEEALALLSAGSAGGRQVFGLGSALSSAMRKVVDAIPAIHQLAATDAAQRILIEPEADLLSRHRVTESIPESIMIEVRRSVLNGRKLRIHYAAEGRDPTWREVDPIGLVTVREKSYLLAMIDGNDRTYRLSRILDAEELAVPAQRPTAVNLAELWAARSARFRAGEAQLVVLTRLDPARREELAGTALAVDRETVDPDGWLRMKLTFQDLRHAEWALWQLGTSAEVLSPIVLRDALHQEAVDVATRYASQVDCPGTSPIRR